jgi:glutathione S-transferase
MTDVVVLGFPRSTYVHIVRLVLTHKDVPHAFRDLEPEMGSATHLALHPFDRVPILQHGDFTLYETSAIATYVDEAFEGPVPQLGIASDEKVVAHALPKVQRALEVLEKALGHGADYILGSEPTLADSRRPPAQSYCARPQMGCFAPSEILTRRKAHCVRAAQSLHPARGNRREIASRGGPCARKSKPSSMTSSSRSGC